MGSTSQSTATAYTDSTTAERRTDRGSRWHGVKRGGWGVVGCLILACVLSLSPWGSTAVFASLGSGDTATGTGALSSDTNDSNGIDNTADGASALTTNNGGNYNTAAGFDALQLNTSGVENTGIGTNALLSNTSGNDNTATGGNALYNNTLGVFNVASGSEALTHNTMGSFNTASGADALDENTGGSNNTAAGDQALLLDTTGNSNTAVGTIAGGTTLPNANTTGSNNTFIGFSAAPAAENLANATAIGANALVGESNALVLGGTGQSAVKVGIGTTTPSSLLQVGAASKKYGSYLQLPLVTSTSQPPAGACNTTTFVGREVAQYNPNTKVATHWLCAPTGKWIPVH